MNRRLFEDLVVSARGRRGSRPAFAVPASVGIHAAVVGGAVLLSALGPADLMPEVTARPAPIAVPVVEVAPPTIAIRNQVPGPAKGGRRSGPPGVPRPAPGIVATPGLPDPDEVDTEPPGCVGPDCFEGAALGPSTASFPTGNDVGTGPPPLVRAVVDVAPPMKVHNVDPVYPELARRAGVEGVVIIECTIDPKGRIAGARVLRGHPLLDRAALEAVEQWAYRPTLLNGAPVSVVMSVTVNFRLAR